jgi:hypothetical protein
MADDAPPSAATEATPPIDSALPSTGARLLAMAAIVVAGVCGGLIGWKVTSLQVSGDEQLWPLIVGLAGATFAAGGVAIVSVLVLRAMGEWRTIVKRDEAAGT